MIKRIHTVGAVPKQTAPGSSILPRVCTRVPRYVHEKGTSKRDWVMSTAAEGLSLLNNLVVLWFSNAGAQEKTTQNSNILAYEYER